MNKAFPYGPSLLGALLLTLTLSFGCSKKAPRDPSVPLSQEELIKRGKVVYMSNCTACHNMDPSKSGSLGPDIKGSSLELLRARVVHGTYPEGYNPKRKTSIMAEATLPHLEPELEAIHAYLNSLD